MKRAIVLARRGAGRVSPNPLVGAVVVRNGRIIGEGYHLYEKKDHAEVVALARAGREAAGASLYLNLEPCAHHGRTPPCVDRIVEAGVREVFVAVRDPNPLMAEKGIAVLRKRRVHVHEGLCREEATRLNEKFFHFIQTNRPFVLLKLALTLDGKIATHSGDSQWITGSQARKQVHRLRYEYDAILVGVGTVLRDDPSLDVRWGRRKHITKVILDSRLRTPAKAKLFNSNDLVVILHSRRAPKERIKKLSQRANLFGLREHNGLLEWDDVLNRLSQLKITSLIIEGGSRIAASCLRAGIVQKINFFYGPKIVGSSGLSGIEDLGVDHLEAAMQVSVLRLKRLSSDFMVEAYLESSS